MARYRLAIFDFDGTLADSFGWCMDTIGAISTEFGFRRLDPARIDEYRGLSAREMVALLGLPWWKLPAVTRGMRRRMQAEIERIGMFEGVSELLAGLEAADIGIALVTSNSAENVRSVLGEANLARITILSCGASLFGKKAKIAGVLKQCRVSAQHALYIGDEIRDAEAASALDVDFLGVSWGYTRPDALQRHSRLALCARPADILAAATTP